MKTFQDLQALGQNENERMQFCLALINEHKSSEAYKTAMDAEEYDARHNVTISNFKRFLTNALGQKVVDTSTATHKLPSGFFPRFMTQINQYLLGNGVKLKDEENKKKLGANFDGRLVKLGRKALVQGCCYGFWNNGNVEIFPLTEFAALPDERSGAIKAGVRFWQLEEGKPLTFVLYEPDGYTIYIKDKDGERTVEEKRSYITDRKTEGGGTVIEESGRNYEGFPIIPLYANAHHQSELVGLRESIDCYDLIKSGFANDVDEATMVYWIFKNVGGMTEQDIWEFINKLKMFHGADVDGNDGVEVTPHTTEAPHEAREKYLQILKNDLYEDAQVIKTSELASGNKTAAEITALYEPMNLKADDFEACVLEFLEGLFAIAGIEDVPSFNRSMIANKKDEVETLLLAAQYLDDEMMLKKLPILTPEEAEEILSRKATDDLNRFSPGPGAEPPEGE